MTGKHSISHLAIMLGTVETWLFKLPPIRGTWGEGNRLPERRVGGTRP